MFYSLVSIHCDGLAFFSWWMSCLKLCSWISQFTDLMWSTCNSNFCTVEARSTVKFPWCCASLFQTASLQDACTATVAMMSLQLVGLCVCVCQVSRNGSEWASGQICCSLKDAMPVCWPLLFDTVRWLLTSSVEGSWKSGEDDSGNGKSWDCWLMFYCWLCLEPGRESF